MSKSGKIVSENLGQYVSFIYEENNKDDQSLWHMKIRFGIIQFSVILNVIV